MVQFTCYHGTSIENAQSILSEKRFRPSVDRDSLRLGRGAYFFCQMGSSRYAWDCARDLEWFHKSKHPKGFGILSCKISCDDDALFDMYEPEVMECFHQIRYHLYEKHKEMDPGFMFEHAYAADTETLNLIRKTRSIAIIRCPQFFGMFERENRIKFSGSRQFPKTYVPNVVLICADTEKATISDIQLVEEGQFDDEFRFSV